MPIGKAPARKDDAADPGGALEPGRDDDGEQRNHGQPRGAASRDRISTARTTQPAEARCCGTQLA